MVDLMKSLEPRTEEKNVILMSENDEVNEVLFFDKGNYVVGFELNKQNYFMIKL